jgi:hypothetical protein
MRLKSLRKSTISELNDRADVFVAACGYESRSTAISSLVLGPGRLVALHFEEWPMALSRRHNNNEMLRRGFEPLRVGGNDSHQIQTIVSDIVKRPFAQGSGVAFDISSMTRAWHGAIVRELRSIETKCDVETFFAYVPAHFRKPPTRPAPNQFVAPVDGFSALGTPDMPVAVIIGLGYEKDRALGLQQLLDPDRTLLMLPKSDGTDRYHPDVIRSNRQILDRTTPESVFLYSLDEPSATFAMLASVVDGLRDNYRVVLASLGPKMFGILCFLLSTRFSGVSVWRVSSGVHGEPRQAAADLDRLVILSAIWGA